jgi:hypothetical protein
MPRRCRAPPRILPGCGSGRPRAPAEEHGSAAPRAGGEARPVGRGGRVWRVTGLRRVPGAPQSSIIRIARGSSHAQRIRGRWWGRWGPGGGGGAASAAGGAVWWRSHGASPRVAAGAAGCRSSRWRDDGRPPGTGRPWRTCTACTRCRNGAARSGRGLAARADRGAPTRPTPAPTAAPAAGRCVTAPSAADPRRSACRSRRRRRLDAAPRRRRASPASGEPTDGATSSSWARRSCRVGSTDTLGPAGTVAQPATSATTSRSARRSHVTGRASGWGSPPASPADTAARTGSSRPDLAVVPGLLRGLGLLLVDRGGGSTTTGAG